MAEGWKTAESRHDATVTSSVATAAEQPEQQHAAQGVRAVERMGSASKTMELRGKDDGREMRSMREQSANGDRCLTWQ